MAGSVATVLQRHAPPNHANTQTTHSHMYVLVFGLDFWLQTDFYDTCASQVFERLIACRLSRFMEMLGMFSCHQYAFRNGLTFVRPYWT